MTIKRHIALLLGVSVIATQLIACGDVNSQDTKDKTDDTIKESEQDNNTSLEGTTDKKGDFKVSEADTTEDNNNKEKEQDTVSNSQAANVNKIYASALKEFADNYVFPDESECAYDASFGNMSDNTFAVSDINNDGNDELVINYITAPMSGQMTNVYSYDSDNNTIQLELMETPQVTFYSNHTAKALWSHNQGLAGNTFWPYNLYRYNSENKSYELVASVDAWDASYADKDFNGNSFPKDIDTEGAGIVYYITQDGVENIVSKTDYDKWYASYFSDGEEIQVDYMAVTSENIEKVVSE